MKTASDEWTVTRIETNPACHGPVEFRLHVACPDCGGTALLVARASLLAPQSRPCPSCGRPRTYRFHPEIVSNLAAKAPRCRAAEEAMIRRYTEAGGIGYRLGSNLLFPISSWLSNGMR